MYLLIYSNTFDEHVSHLRAVFERLKAYNLVLNRDKCVFAQQEITFLGHLISAAGVAPLPSKVEAICNFPQPRTLKQLKRFLGMLNFYPRFLKDTCALTAPLNRMLSPKHHNKKRELAWDHEGIAAFERVKFALADLAVLSFPVRGVETIVVCDASDVAVGSASNQVIDGELRPIGFFSKALTKTQKTYSVIDRELLGIFLAVKHFSYFLETVLFCTSKLIIYRLLMLCLPISVVKLDGVFDNSSSSLNTPLTLDM